MNTPSAGATPPTPGTIPAAEVAAVRAAWATKAGDIGLGLYNPSTGEIHIGTFDTTGLGIGHDGLQMTLGIPDVDRSQWRGFIFSSNGQAINNSGFNVVDGSAPRMLPVYFAQVEDALQRGGLI